MASLNATVTILDLPEILEIMHEALDAVPPWERQQLKDRLQQILDRAHEHKRTGR